MKIAYENGTMVVTHGSGKVSIYSREDYFNHIYSETERLNKLQLDLEQSERTLALIDASKGNSMPIT